MVTTTHAHSAALLGVFDGLVCSVGEGFVWVGEIDGLEGLAAFGSSGWCWGEGGGGGGGEGRGGGGAQGDEGIWSFADVSFAVGGVWIGDDLNVVLVIIVIIVVIFIFVSVALVFIDGAGLSLEYVALCMV